MIVLRSLSNLNKRQYASLANVCFSKALKATARTASSKAMDQSGAAAIQVAKVQATDKVTLSEVLMHNRTFRARSTETSDGLAAIQAQLNNLGREVKKVNEKVYAAQVGCEQCKGGGHRATTLGFYQRNNTNPSFQERRQSMEDTLIKFMGELAKRHEENSNLIKEIRASMDAAIRKQGASIKTLEIQIGSIRRIGSPQYAVSTGLNSILMYDEKQTKIPFPSRLNDYYWDDEKGSYGP
ncbi:hypothetical protein Tco_1185800 [Tanacetum coccineum]